MRLQDQLKSKLCQSTVSTEREMINWMSALITEERESSNRFKPDISKENINQNDFDAFFFLLKDKFT